MIETAFPRPTPQDEHPRLSEPQLLPHVKPLVLGHWGTTPGQKFIYVHLNPVIKERDLNMIYIAGPGLSGPALLAHTYLEGRYSEVYPNISEAEARPKRLFTQSSFPGDISNHVAPTTPGSKIVDGLQVEGTFRAHQVPLLVDRAHPEHVGHLAGCMKSNKAEELFSARGSEPGARPETRCERRHL
jgi:phosphoketolase